MVQLSLATASAVLSFCSRVFAAAVDKTAKLRRLGPGQARHHWRSGQTSAVARHCLPVLGHGQDHMEHKNPLLGHARGPRHILTIRHCVPQSGSGITMRFAPSYYDGERLGGSSIMSVIYPTTGFHHAWCTTAFDMVIMITADRIGDTRCYLGVKVPQNNQPNPAMFYHYRYPVELASGQRPYRQEGISAWAISYCEQGGPMTNDIDAAGGQSGGPPWLNENGNRSVYGVLARTGDTVSTSANGPRLLDMYNSARASFP
ncbi:hypothetical protein B0H63DRAFT_445129 [Podospora didyma]|uniref:Serine protease n=1 Tax=Podospora didyma TaxID=330526 RepID=A0AAE0U8M0_9PEZI|nr:hypothetical protein B0H63DRAFT_445129 [Podospora didyma]